MSNRERLNDIDWLRVMAMLMIFFYHCARFFNYEDWHVKNNQLNFYISIFVEVVSQWIMPLFFIVSAISSYYSLSYRKGGQYINERLKRLVIPLIFGSFVIIAPLQVWIERVSHGQFSGSFLRFYPHYFEGFYGFGGNFAWMGLHLWYLEILFIFSLITLPLFIYFRKERMQGLVSKVALFCNKPGFIFFPAIPLFVMELLVNLQPDGLGMRKFGGWSVLTYLVFFIIGYLIASDSHFRQAIERQRIAALIMALILTTLAIFPIEALRLFSSYTFRNFMRAFNSWCWLAAILGFGSKYLILNNRFLKYSNEAVLPFYIMHQTVIVWIGFCIAHWNLSVITKFFIMTTSSFFVIVGLYEAVIQRVGAFRFLFGMKHRYIDHELNNCLVD